METPRPTLAKSLRLEVDDAAWLVDASSRLRLTQSDTIRLALSALRKQLDGVPSTKAGKAP
jgi:hypothetical protein